MDSRVVAVHDVSIYAQAGKGVNKKGGNCCGSRMPLVSIVDGSLWKSQLSSGRDT